MSRDFLEGVGDAIADIRQKVVEEGYFGRAVTQLDVDTPHWPEAKEAEPAPSQEQNQEQEHEAPEQDIDR